MAEPCPFANASGINGSMTAMAVMAVGRIYFVSARISHSSMPSGPSCGSRWNTISRRLKWPPCYSCHVCPYKTRPIS
jgi:hypothetical protein